MSVSIGDVIGTIKLEDTFSPKLEIAARNVEQFAGKLDKIGSRFEDVGKRLSVSVTLPIAAITGMAVKSSVALNETLANVSALLTDVSGAELDRTVGKMKGQVQELARDMGKSTKDISEGLYEVISSLGNTEDTFGQLEISAKAAAAGLASTQEAFGLLSAVTKTYGDTSETAFKKVADLAFQAVNIGQTTFPQLSASIGSVASIAQYAGVPLEELFAIIATATGVTGNTSEVTTQMASAISALIDPSKELNKLLKEQGLASAQAAIAEKGLAGTLQMIVDHANATGKPLADLLGRKEAILLAASLAGSQEEQFAKNLTLMGEAAAASGGIVEDAFDKQTNGVNKAGFAWKQFLADVEIAQQKLGDQLVPILLDVGESLRPMFNGLLKLIEGFGKLPDPVKASVVVLAGLAALSGPVLFALGGILQGATYLIPVIKSLTAVHTSLNGAILATQAGYGKLVLLSIAAKFREWSVAALTFATSFTAIGTAIIGVLLLINQYITRMKEAMQLDIEKMVGDANQLGQSLDRLRQVRDAGGVVSGAKLQELSNELTTISDQIDSVKARQKDAIDQVSKKYDDQIARIEKLAGRQTTQSEQMRRFKQSEIEKLKEANQAELQGLESRKRATISALNSVTQVLEEETQVVEETTTAFGSLTEEQEKALASINARVDAMAREMDARTALLAALKQSPEAYLAEQRAQEINNAVFEARQQLLEAEAELSPELKARIEEITGAIFDSTIATEKYNETLSAVAASISSLSSINIPKLNTGGDANAVKQWAGSLASLRFRLDDLRSALQKLSKDSAEYKNALAVLTETEKQYQAEAARLPEIMEDRKSAWSSEMRSVLAVAESTSRQINTEIAVLGRGAAAWSSYQRDQEARARAIQVLGVFNLPKPDASDRKALAEWRSLFDQYNSQLESLTRDIQIRLDFEIAADLKLDLETPLESLRTYKAAIDALTQSFDQSGNAALSTADADRLKAQATEQFVSEQLNNWTGFLSQLGDQFGGFFSYLHKAAQTLQQAQNTGSSVSSLASGLGASSGMASMMGAFGVYVVLAKAAYDEFKRHGEARRARKYDTAAATSDYGIGWKSPGMEGQQRVLVSQIQATAEAFAAAIGGVISTFASLEIKIRGDGKYFRAIVEGELVGQFESMEEAISAGMLAVFTHAKTKIVGLSDLVQQGFAEIANPELNNTAFESLEEAQKFLGALNDISSLGFSPLIQQMREGISRFDGMRTALDHLDSSSVAVIEGYDRISASQQQFVESFRNQILGVNTAVADLLADLDGFQRGIEDLAKGMEEALRNRIAVIEESIERMGTGPTQFIGSRKDGEGVSQNFTQAEWDAEMDRLKKAVARYREELAKIPKALTDQELGMAVFDGLYRYVEGSAKYEADRLKYAKLKVDLEFALIKGWLVALEMWEQFAAMFGDAYAAALAAAGQRPSSGRGGGGGKVDRKEIREDLLDQIADVEAELKGPLHSAFLQFSRALDEFKEKAKEGKLSAEDTARGIAALTARFQENIRAQANTFAGIGTDFTKRLDAVADFFKELRELGRKTTGMPNWLVNVLEGKAFEALGKELDGAIAAFGGLVDPMLAVNAQADTLRQNVLAYAEAAGWSADQIATAMAAIDRGAEYQRQQGINSTLDRLFAWAKQAGILAKESIEHERSKALLDITVIEAQLRFYGALTAEIEGWIGGIRNWINSAAFGLGNDVQDVRIVGNSTADVIQTLVDKIKSMVEAWRAAVDQFADATNNLMTDEALTNLTQEEQLAFAKSQAEDLAAKARAGDADALAKLDAARAEYLRELRESEGTGFGFTQGFNWIMGLSADILENAQSAEESLIARELADNVAAWSHVMQQLADQLEAAFYENNQDLIDAIYDAIGGVPGLAQGGIVTRGPRLVRVAEQVAEAIVPLDKLATAIPYNRFGMAGQTVDHTAGAQNRSGSGGSTDGISVYDQSARFRMFQRQDDSSIRLAKIEASNQATAQAMVRMQQDMNALRRRLSS